MVRTLSGTGNGWVPLSTVLMTVIVMAQTVWSQGKPAYDLLPATTQAVVWIRDTDELVGRWDRTQLSKLASDSAIRPFWEDQRKQIEKRFMEAVWRLNIGPSDLQELAAGQLAIAWIEKPGNKPFAMALIADVVDDAKKLEAFFTRLEKNLPSAVPKRAVRTWMGSRSPSTRSNNPASCNYGKPTTASSIINC